MHTVLKKGFAFFSRNFFQLFVPTLLILVSYQHILSYEFVIDDIGSVDAYKHLNQLVPFFKSPAESTRSLLYFFMYTIGHGKPFAFHMVSLFFHIGCVWVLYCIVWRMINKKVAFIASILAAVHPIFVESVTWISGSPYVEYSFFALLSLLFYMQIDLNNHTRVPFYKNKFYFFSFIMYIAATLFSEKAVVFPLLLGIYELAFGNLKKNWRRFLPFITIMIVWVLFYLPMARHRVVTNSSEYHLKVGLENPFVQIPIAITSYFQLLFWPDKLSIYHSELRFSMTEIVLRFIGLLIFFGVTTVCFLKPFPGKKYSDHGSKFFKTNRLIFFWLAWFFVSLAPTLLPVRLSWIYAERYVYLGSMGIIIIFSLGFYEVFRSKSTRTLGGLILFAIISGCVIRTYIRNLDWRSEDHLWLATATASPSDFKTHNNVGTVYMKQGDIARAEREFIIALAINKHYADAYYNLGLLYMNNNIFDRAERNYILAIREKKTYWQAYNGLTIVYLANKKFDKAEAFAKKTIELKPDFPGGYNNLGLMYQVQGRYPAAIANFKKALSLDATLWQTEFNLALLYYLENDSKSAELHIANAKKSGTDTSAFYTRLAQVYMSMKKDAEAKQAITIALEMDPTDKQTQEVAKELQMK